MHKCDWRVTDEQTGREAACGKLAVAHITWPGGAKGRTTYWYCAPHYDERLNFVRHCKRHDVLTASGVK